MRRNWTSYLEVSLGTLCLLVAIICVFKTSNSPGHDASNVPSNHFAERTPTKSQSSKRDQESFVNLLSFRPLLEDNFIMESSTPHQLILSGKSVLGPSYFSTVLPDEATHKSVNPTNADSFQLNEQPPTLNKTLPPGDYFDGQFDNLHGSDLELFHEYLEGM